MSMGQPGWARTAAGRSAEPIGWPPFAITLLACLLAASTAIVLALEGMGRTALVLMLLTVSGALIYLGWALMQLLKARSQLRLTERRFGEIYQRAGISIWQEDWSAVGDGILALTAAGVEDLAAWHAANPAEAARLHRSVRITGINSYSVELMGASDPGQLIGSLADVLPGSRHSFLRWMQALARGDRVYVGESRITRLDGSLLECLVTAALPQDREGLSDIQVSIVDITAYKQDRARLEEVEADVARAQRIAALGALTASIAHEINSPLAAIMANAGATLRWLDRAEPDLPEAREAARALVDEAARARGVMDRARAMLIQRQAGDVRFALDGAVAVATRSVRDMAVRRGIEIETRVEAGIEIDGDAMQIQQVLINLMLNAVQAMQAVSGERRLALEARREGDDVRVEVTDNGPGLSPALLTSCFDPFFSTKPDGMGMGLAICRSCVEAHGGRIWASSPAGGGAAFHILLPLAGDA